MHSEFEAHKTQTKERYSGINTVLLTAFSTEELKKVLYDNIGTTDIHKCKTRKKSFQSCRLMEQKWDDALKMNWQDSGS